MERTYNVPLRREFTKVPKYKRSKKALLGLKTFLVKHMKSEDVRIGKYANEYIWRHGIRNPPHHIKVVAIKDDKGVVRAELFGAPKEEQKQVEEKGLMDKVKDTITGKKESANKEQAKSTPASSPIVDTKIRETKSTENSNSLNEKSSTEKPTKEPTAPKKPRAKKASA